jgi:hypothetical protein
MRAQKTVGRIIAGISIAKNVQAKMQKVELNFSEYVRQNSSGDRAHACPKKRWANYRWN